MNKQLFGLFILTVFSPIIKHLGYERVPYNVGIIKLIDGNLTQTFQTLLCMNKTTVIITLQVFSITLDMVAKHRNLRISFTHSSNQEQSLAFRKVFSLV